MISLRYGVLGVCNIEPVDVAESIDIVDLAWNREFTSPSPIGADEE